MKLNRNNFYKCCCILSLIIFYKLLGYIYYKISSVYIMDIKEKFQLQKNSYISHNIKVALCTMGKKENLYVNEFAEYYFNLGFDHLFIYDDNDPNDEKLSNAIGSKYKDNITIYENVKKNNINRQDEAFNDCYMKNSHEYDLFAMFDMYEYL